MFADLRFLEGTGAVFEARGKVPVTKSERYAIVKVRTAKENSLFM